MVNSLFSKSCYPSAPTQNGIGRFVRQLQRITIKFCKHSGSSKGVRDFIETELVSFAKDHPSIVVYLKPRRHHSPHIVAEYLNGGTHHIKLHNFTKDEIRKWLYVIKDQSGLPIARFRKMWHTDHPSIQGPWTPFLFRDPRLNLVDKFPKEELSHYIRTSRTATEILVEMFQHQQAEASQTEHQEKETSATP